MPFPFCCRNIRRSCTTKPSCSTMSTPCSSAPAPRRWIIFPMSIGPRFPCRAPSGSSIPMMACAPKACCPRSTRRCHAALARVRRSLSISPPPRRPMLPLSMRSVPSICRFAPTCRVRMQTCSRGWPVPG